MKGKTLLGTGTLRGGSATFTTSTLKVGTDSITAAYAGDSNFAAGKSKAVKQLVNEGVELISITVEPADGVMAVGSTLQFTAIGLYNDGSIKILTSSATWSSSLPSAATVAPGGLATGVAPGTTVITASVGEISGGAELTVH